MFEWPPAWAFRCPCCLDASSLPASQRACLALMFEWPRRLVCIGHDVRRYRLSPLARFSACSSRLDV
eukprot:88404-Pleurochrysis_carterae.AAC.1